MRAWILVVLTAVACGDNTFGNRAPTVEAFTLTTDEDLPITRTLDVVELDGNVLTARITTPPEHGTAEISGLSLTYTPAANYHGADHFVLTVDDGFAAVTADVDVVVVSVPDQPIGGEDSLATNEDTPRTVPLAQLLANDTDADGDTVSITEVGSATNGTVAIVGDNVTFTPDANFNGNASFTYMVTDGMFVTPVLVSVLVGGANDAPDATDDSATTAEDTAAVIPIATLLGNDTDPENQTLTLESVQDPTNGTVSITGANVTFTPAADFNGTATFTYTISDGAIGDTATVTVTVTPVNDPVTAVDDSGTTDEDTPITFSNLTANDVDVDIATQSQTLAVTAVTNAVNGTVAINGGQPIFTPTTNATTNQTGSFDYTVSDGNGSTDTGTVTITITPVNDPPVATADSVAQIDAPTTYSHASLLANDSDGGDGAALTITAVGGATGGTVTLQATTVTFTPSGAGAASFQYTISDGGVTTSTATVTVNVVDCGNGVIEAPEACDDGSNGNGDGCSAACTIEAGFTCNGAPSNCNSICGDGLVVGDEDCDDENAVETDGCTTQCVAGPKCTVAEFPDGVAFATDPATGHCYVRMGTPQSLDDSESSCTDLFGHLAVITSAEENVVVQSVNVLGVDPWLGAINESSWITNEPFVFDNYANGEPSGAGDCVVLAPNGEWLNVSCNATRPSICEYEANPCGDGILHGFPEECDDGNNTDGDGCSATCQLEDGCGDGNLDPGEECDDNNILDGDGCSASCTFECGDGTIGPTEECDDSNRTSGDGCSSSCTKELPYFSEYVHREPFTKFLEIFNPGPFFSLGGCTIDVYNDGSLTPASSFAFQVGFSANGTFTLCHAFGSGPVSFCSQSVLDPVISFTGNDTLQLVCPIGGVPTVLDTIGQLGFDPGTEWGVGALTTNDHTLRRRCTDANGKAITHGNLNPGDDFNADLVNEWVGFPGGTLDGLNSHVCP